METSLHEMIDWRFVVHTHPYTINALTCSKNGEAAARELFGKESLWVLPARFHSVERIVGHCCC